MRWLVAVVVCLPLVSAGCWGSSSAASSGGTQAVAEVVVPQVTPMYLQDAENALRSSGLQTVIASVPPLTDADGSTNGYAIRRQWPTAGTRLAAGSPVTLTLAYSLNGGPGGVGSPGVVRNLVGLPVNVAMREAFGLGLHVSVSGVDQPISHGTVTRQSLLPGTRVAPGAIITIHLG